MEHVAIPVVPVLLLVLVIALLVVAGLGFVISLLMGQRPRKETVGLVSVVGGTLLLMAAGVWWAGASIGFRYVPRDGALVLMTIVMLMGVAGLGFAISRLRGSRSVPKEGVGLVSVVGGPLLLMIAAVGLWRTLVFVGVNHAARVAAAEHAAIAEGVIQEAREYRPTGIPVEALAERLPREARRPGLDKETLPEWVTEEGGELRVIRGSQQATPELARQAAMGDAVEAVRAHFQSSRGGVPGLELVPDKGDIERLAVRRTHTETIERTTGKHDFLMYRTYVRIDTAPSVMAELEEASREKARDVRSVQVFIWFAVLAGIAGLVSVFFRIDERLRGRYRPLLVAGTLAGTVFLLILPVMGKDHLPEISKDWVRGFDWGTNEAQTEFLPQSWTIAVPVYPMGEVEGPNQLLHLHEMSYRECFDDDD